MAVAEEGVGQRDATERLRVEVQTFASEHRRALQIAGVVAVAGVTGAVGGWLVVKGIVATKGAAMTNLVLAAKGVAAKAGAVPFATTLTPSSTTVAGATTTAAPTAASLSQMVSMLNNSAANGVALADKAMGLWNMVSTNIIPLTAGVVGGGAAGVGVAQNRVRKVQEQLDEQRAKTENLQAETTQLQQSLSTAATQLQLVQEQLTPVAPPTPAPATPPVVPPEERLERINGIGRVFAQRLNEAGIYTITDLAAQTAEVIEAIIGRSRAGAMFDPAAWIAEARTLTGAPTESGPPNAETAEAAETVDLSLDPLEAIAGISPAIAARLNQAGILTYSDLADQSPEQIALILERDPGASLDDIVAWISAAQTLSARE